MMRESDAQVGTLMADPIKNRSVLRWLGYALRGFIILILLLAAIGATYQSIESSRDLRVNPPPGRFVDVGGHKMHLVCTGQGAPTVLLESGLSNDWLVWYKVQPAISKLTRVCSYDRAGLGFSDPRPEQQPDSRNIAHNLHMLLTNAGVNPPYVLVGHSIGGIHIRVYQNLYPADIVGMVLVDSGHPDQEKRIPPEMKEFQSRLYFEGKLWGLAVPLGLTRLMGACDGEPPEIKAMQRTVECRWQAVKASEAEVNASASEDEGRHTGSLGSLPLVVLSRDPEKGAAPGLIPPELSRRFEDQWSQMQEELVHLSTNGSQVIATGSSHYAQMDRPDVVIAGIQEVVDAARLTSK
jgi:pimeloyl-ACP methyl ester carboxylesterase